MCDTLHSKKGNKEEINLLKLISKEIYGVPYHPYAIQKLSARENTNRIELHRLVYEAHLNKLSLLEYIKILKYDKQKAGRLKYIDPSIYHIHHINEDRLNNSIENLECLEKTAHLKLHSHKQQYNFNQGTPIYSKVKSVTYIGIEDTYDIICKNPYHNFVANGMVVHNSGKSISILGLIAEVKQPTLILVHEHRLRTQWEQEITTRLTGSFKFGRYDGDKRIEGDVVIGLIQTVQKMMDTDPTWINKYGMIITDECHKVSAPTFLKVLNNSKSKWRIGVTGTVKRKDGKHLLIYDVLGPVLLELEEKDLKHRITGFDFEIVNTNIRLELPSISRWTGKGRELSIDITHALGVLTSSHERNALILSHIVKSIQDGYFPLVLSDRVEHCKYFSNALTELGYNSILLIGATRKKADWSTIRGDTSLECIIAQSSIASEGLDFPRLSALHLTCPSSNLPKIKQRIGRIRRYIEGKVMPKVYDYVDNLAYYTDSYGNPQYIFKGGAYKRIKFYKQLQTDYDT